MKRIIKLVVRVLIIAVVVAALYAVNLFLKPVSKMKASLAQSSIAAPINVDGEAFRDLNRNGSLDPYEDHRVATTDRVECGRKAHGAVFSGCDFPKGLEHAGVAACSKA